MDVFLRKATVSDVKSIHRMLLDCAQHQLLLPRSLNELYSHIRDFVVAHNESGQICGCCALSITWEELAEVRSLVVLEDWRQLGLGRMLVEACLEEALAFGVYKVFTLTYQVAFFERLGFGKVSKDVLPQKVWADCLKCPRFPECDEVAMMATFEHR